MIECKECETYVNGLFNRGEITKEEIEKVMLDRHILKGCPKKVDPFLEWITYTIENQLDLQKENIHRELPQWNKGYLAALLDAKGKYNARSSINEMPHE